MGETLTGPDGMTLYTMSIIAGAVIVCLALLFWVMKRRGHMIFMRGGNNRQPRLAVLDAAAVDSRRRLVLVRRDNIEHLILIGGPSDIVVESGISRAAAAAQAEKAKQASKAAAAKSAAATAAQPAPKPATEKRAASDPKQPQPTQATKPTAAAPAKAPVQPSKPETVQKAPEPKAKPAKETKADDRPDRKKPDAKRDESLEDVRSSDPEPSPSEIAPVTVAATATAAAVAVEPVDLAVNGHQKAETTTGHPLKSESLQTEFEDALEAARDLVMPETKPATETPPSPELEMNYAHAVPAPPDPVPAPPMPEQKAEAPTTAEPGVSADDLIADFDRVLEAEMSKAETKTTAKIHQISPPPADDKEPAEKHDIASLEDEMKKLLGDLSVKQ
jgi:flagellar biogenesis protein FliO